MKNFDKIHRGYYFQLVKLVGKEEADDYFKKGNVNYAAASLRILYLRLKKYSKMNPKLFTLVLSLIIASIILYFLNLFLII